MSMIKETTGSVPLTPLAPHLWLPSLLSAEPESELSTLEDQVLHDEKVLKEALFRSNLINM
jgi:hypothetical protein